MKKNNTVWIRVPEDMMDHNPTVVAAGVARRMARATAINENEILRRITVVAFILIALLGVSTVGHAEPVPEAVVEATVDAPWVLTEEEEQMVARAVSATAKGESDLAMEAVAQCIKNAIDASNGTQSVSDVLSSYKYAMDDGDVPDNCLEAVRYIQEGNIAVHANITSCYNPKIQSGIWHETQTYVCTIGNLKFFE